MQIVVSHNFPQVQARLDQLQRDIAQKATVRAVNRTVEQANTQMRRAIGEEFNLTSSKIREKLFIRRARYSQGVFGIQAELLSRRRVDAGRSTCAASGRCRPAAGWPCASSDVVRG